MEKLYIILSSFLSWFFLIGPWTVTYSFSRAERSCSCDSVAGDGSTSASKDSFKMGNSTPFYILYC